MLSMTLQGSTMEPSDLVIRIGRRAFRKGISAKGDLVTVPISLAPESFVKVLFEYSGKRLTVPGDQRELYFALINPRLEDR
jgi:hypothetical protein